MKTVRTVTIDLLRELGINRVFGNPGSTELPMFRDFPDDFTYTLGLQESVVVAMADGYAQATRNAALVNLHSSAGTGHAMGNIFTAYKNCAPLIITAGQQARSILPYEPFLYADRASEFPRPFVKWSCEPARAEDVPRAILRAYQIAMTPPFGPTFVSVPVDDWDKPAESIDKPNLDTINPGSPTALNDMAAAICTAKSPALILGAGCARSQAWHAAIALAEKRQIPVYIAPFASRNVFPEDHRLFRGFMQASQASIVSTLSQHDCVFAFGGPVNLYHTEGTGQHLPEGSQLWVTHDDPNLLSFAPATRCIQADPRLALEQLATLCSPASLPNPSPLPKKSLPNNDLLTVPVVMNCIAETRPTTGSIIVEEAPSSRPAMQDWLPMTEEDQFYTTASGGLGYGMPASVGIALARKDNKVIVLVGDGSSMYSIQSLFSAAQNDLAISFLIVNNGAYEALRSFGKQFDLGKVEGTDLTGLDFPNIAAGFGIEGKSVSNLTDLKTALEWSFSHDKTSLVDIRVSHEI